jgi:hypothetical protein
MNGNALPSKTKSTRRLILCILFFLCTNTTLLRFPTVPPPTLLAFKVADQSYLYDGKK